MSSMQLASASVHLLTLKLRVPFTTSFGTATEFQRPFVILETVDGVRGVGEVPTLNAPAYKAEVDPPAVLTSLREYILPSVARYQVIHEGFDGVADLRASYEWIKGANFAKSGVEAACWDILAQQQGVPLWQLWGGSQRTFPVGVSIGGKTVEQVLALAENATSLGYQRLKVKIWPGFEHEVVTALRQRYPEILLQVDANSAYDMNNWRLLQALDPYNLLLIEQPLFDDDIVLHSEIARELRTPVCLDESIHSLRDVQSAMRLWQANGVLDRLVINIKPPRVSGFAEAIAIAQECHAHGVKTWIGGMLDSAWGKAMNLNFNGLAEIDLPGDHFSPGGAYFEEDVVAEPLTAPGGLFALASRASNGVEIDWEAFHRLGDHRFTVDI